MKQCLFVYLQRTRSSSSLSNGADSNVPSLVSVPDFIHLFVLLIHSDSLSLKSSVVRRPARVFVIFLSLSFSFSSHHLIPLTGADVIHNRTPGSKTLTIPRRADTGAHTQDTITHRSPRNTSFCIRNTNLRIRYRVSCTRNIPVSAVSRSTSFAIRKYVADSLLLLLFSFSLSVCLSVYPLLSLDDLSASRMSWDMFNDDCSRLQNRCIRHGNEEFFNQDFIM